MALLHDSKNWYKVQWRATFLHKWLSSYFYVYFEGSPLGEEPRVLCQEVILPFFICSRVARGKKKRSHFMDVEVPILLGSPEVQGHPRIAPSGGTVALPQENLGTSLTTKCSIYYQNYDLYNL